MVSAGIFIFKNWKIIVSSLTALAVGFGAAWWIQGIRADKLEVKNEQLKVEIQESEKANKTNQKTIMGLQKEIKSAGNICSSRLRVKDNVIAGLKHIDSLKPKTEGKGNEENISAVGDDPVLHELNRMFGAKADSKD